MDEAVGTAVVCPPDIEEYGIRHGIPEFTKATWYAGYQQAMKDTLAADAARAVGDEEVVRVLDDNFTRLEVLNVLELLQAAGLKVVRG